MKFMNFKSGNKYKQFIIIYAILCPLILIPVFTLFDLFATEQFSYQIKKILNKEPVDILYFSDSTSFASGRCESSRETIDEFINEVTPKKILKVTDEAYSAIIYQDYVKLLRHTKYKPKLVIIQLNLRTFSDNWYKNPYYMFKVKKESISFFNSYRFNIYNYINYRYMGKLDKEIKEWKNSEVIYGNKLLGTNGTIQEEIKITEHLECLGREYDYKEKLSLAFRYHYMNNIKDNHPFFNDLNNTLEELKNLNIKVLVYLTPINMEDGVRYVGDEFRSRVNSNVETITEYLKKSGIDYIDMSSDLRGDYFVDKRYSCEHVNSEGRRQIANKIVNFLKNHDFD